MKSNVIEIEISTPNSQQVYFNPAGRALRGAWDYLKMSRYDRTYSRAAIEYPRGIPGMRVRADLDANRVTITDPLATADWTTEREKVAARGQSPVPDVEFKGVYMPNWLHEIKRTLECGCAKIVEGKLPDDLGEDRLVEVLNDSHDKSAAAMTDIVRGLAEGQMVLAQGQEEMRGQIRDLLKILASK